MGGRTRRLRTLGHPEDSYLMEALSNARKTSTQAMGKVEINCEVYKALDALNHAIDKVCVATGRPREHFWVKANSA